MAVLRKIDAVTVRVPDLESGLAFYRDHLGHDLKWTNGQQAGLRLPETDAEIVLTTEHRYEPNWLVDDVRATAQLMALGGGSVVVEPFDIPVGRVAVAADPFGNPLVLIELSKGTYTTDAAGNVTGVSQRHL